MSRPSSTPRPSSSSSISSSISSYTHAIPMPTSSTTITTQPTKITVSSSGQQQFSNINLWTLAGATAALVVSAAGIYWYYSSSAKPKPTKSAHHPIALNHVDKEIKEAPSTKSTPLVTPPRRAPAKAAPISAPTKEYSDAELGLLLSMSMSQLQMNQNDPSTENTLRSIGIPLASLLARPPDVRAFYGQWLLTISTFHLTSSNDQTEFDANQIAQDRDMRVAWKLLEGTEQLDEKRELDILRMQVSSNLKDPALMIPVFERMITREGEKGDDDILTLLSAAPLLGRWKAVVEMGDEFLARHGPYALKSLHDAPLDYETLYHQAQQLKSTPAPRISSLQWVHYNITYQRIRLRDVTCDDPQSVQELRGEFAGTTDASNMSNSDEEGWKVVNLTQQSKIIRCGAICQVNSFSTVPMALVGPATSDSLECKGYSDLQAECVVRQTESYSLRCDTEEEMVEVTVDDLLLSNGSHNVEKEGEKRRKKVVKSGVERYWKGTYTMTQEKADPDAPGQFARIHVVFDLEMKLKSMPSASM